MSVPGVWQAVALTEPRYNRCSVCLETGKRQRWQTWYIQSLVHIVQRDHLEGILLEIEIKDLRKRDYDKAIQFAITGMHFDLYLDNDFLLHLYGRYFWYSELNCATQVIAAYIGEELTGVLLADMKGEEKTHKTVRQRIYVKLFEFLQNTFYKGGVGVYDAANRELFSKYTGDNTPDGQIVFLAANPDAKIKGVGSRLLTELERRENGKEIYLYTDDACTYQFYEQRGFRRSCEKEVVMNLGNKKVPLKCFLYSKIMN